MKVKRVVRSEYALLALLTLPAVLALLLNSGLPNTADGVLHVFRTFELDRAWRDMVWYPRIAPDFAYGYGYPIFNYYAPLFYFAAEIFHAAGLNLEWAVKTVIVLTFYLYALGMYLLARRWLRPAAAIAAAVAYVYTPYRFYEAFIQGDYPQFLALALVPFCLWAVTPLLAQANPHPNPPPPPRTRSRPSRTTRGTGEGEDTPSSVEEVSERGRLGWGSRYTFAFIAAYTALLLAHNITALIVTPLIGAYMVFLFALDAWHSLRSTAQPGPERSRRPWLEPGRRLAMRAGRVVLAIGLSVGLAAFFWLPALGEQKYVRIERLTRGFFDFRNYFLTPGELLSPNIPPDLAGVNPYIPFNLGPAILIAAAAGLALHFLLRITRRDRPAGFIPLALHLFFALAALALAAMTLPLSTPLWENVPLLTLTEFPWRFVGVAAIPLAVLAGIAAQLGAGVWSARRAATLRLPPAIPALIAALIALDCFVYLFPRTPFLPYTDVSLSDIANFELSGQALGTTSAGEYLPIWTQRRMYDSPLTSQLLRDAIPDHLQRDALPVTVHVSVVAETVTRATYHFVSAGPLPVHVERIYFPGWTATIDGQPVPLELLAPEGTMQVSLPAGDHIVDFQFGETPLRLAADGIAWLCLAAVAGWWLLERRRVKAPAAAPAGPETAWQPGASTPFAAAALVLIAFYFVAPRLGYVRFSHLPEVSGMQHARGDNLGDTMRLLGYDLSAASVTAGDALALTLYWQPLQVSEKDYAVFSHLDNPQTLETVAQTLNDHPGNISTIELPLSLYVRDPHVLRVPESVEPGLYLLRIGMIDPRTGTALSAAQPDGTLRTRVTLQTVRVRRAAPVDLSRVTRVGAHFGSVELAGYTLDGRQLTLYWRTAQAQAADATVFVHLLDASNQTIATFDGPPANGLLPSSAWDPGEIVVDRRTINPPSPGTYRIAIGLYDPQSVQRYPASDPSGQRLAGDQLVLDQALEMK